MLVVSVVLVPFVPLVLSLSADFGKMYAFDFHTPEQHMSNLSTSRRRGTQQRLPGRSDL